MAVTRFLLAAWLAGAVACAGGPAAPDPGPPDAPDAAPDPGPADVPPDLPVADVPAADVPPDLPPADVRPDLLPADVPAADVPPADAPPDLPAVDTDVPEAPWEPAAPGGYRVNGDALVDDRGRALMLHGVNVTGLSKGSAGHLPPWHTPDEYRRLAAAGFDSVRLLTFWGAVMPQEGVLDEAYLQGYLQHVQWAADAGLRVIADMHQDIFGFGFHENGAPAWACDASHYESYVPREPWYLNYLDPDVRACFMGFYQDDAIFGRFVDAWVALATRLKDHPGVVGFDLLNEPNPASFDAARFVPDLWQPRQEQLAAALHAVAPDRVVFFEGATLAAVGFVDAFTPSPDPAIAYAPHYYHPGVHDGGAYDPESDLFLLDAAVDAIDASARNLGGVPVWVGEWGGPPAVAGFDRYMEDLLVRFAARRWSWAWWDDSAGGFGIRNPDLSFVAPVVQRLSHPSLRRVPGPVADASLAFGPDGSQRYEATFRWRAAGVPLDLWTGPGGTALVLSSALRQDEPWAATCTRPDGAPDGLLSCDAGDAPPGMDWRVVLDRPAPAP